MVHFPPNSFKQVKMSLPKGPTLTSKPVPAVTLPLSIRHHRNPREAQGPLTFLENIIQAGRLKLRDILQGCGSLLLQDLGLPVPALPQPGSPFLPGCGAQHRGLHGTGSYNRASCHSRANLGLETQSPQLLLRSPPLEVTLPLPPPMFPSLHQGTWPLPIWEVEVIAWSVSHYFLKLKCSRKLNNQSGFGKIKQNKKPKKKNPLL